jgi:hypothetical protein
MLLLLLLAGCGKDQTGSITYKTVSVTLAGIGSDTISNFGCPTLFEIYRNDSVPPADTLSIRVIVNPGPGLIVGCTGPGFLCGPYGPSPLLVTDPINSAGNWTVTGDVLVGFAGKGDLFLGYRTHPDAPELNYNYGWIRVKVSAHSDTLWIFDFAINNTLNEEIRAGQISF